MASPRHGARPPHFKPRSGRLEREILAPRCRAPLVALMDGKPLPFGGASKGPPGRLRQGDRLQGQGLQAAPARRNRHQTQGYVVADANYYESKLHDVCLGKGESQLVTPCRMPKAEGLGHRHQSPGRLRSLEMVRSKTSGFGKGLLKQRQDIERFFGQLTSFGCGLQQLPSWVRTHRRVRRWVQAKPILNGLRTHALASSCAT